MIFDLREQSVYHNIKYDGILNTGEYAEHVFSDNLRNGINTVDGIEYRINFVSVLRRALDLR